MNVEPKEPNWAFLRGLKRISRCPRVRAGHSHHANSFEPPHDWYIFEYYFEYFKRFKK